MILPVVPFPVIDPVAVELGPLAIRWYALAYLVGLIVGWRLARRLAVLPPYLMRADRVDDLLAWMVLGVVAGGRLGYVLFYKPGYYLLNPDEVLFLWQGGMSFHGGLAGVVLASFLFARRHKLPFLRVGDVVAAVAPLGLLLGRLANFVNGELYGRASDVSWAMVFPSDPAQLPRHPSQLYEAALEGLALGLVMLVLASRERVRAKPGLLAGTFFLGYGLARSFAEFFREPDAHLGFILGPVTMGQLLCLPLIVAGLFLLVRRQ